MPPPRIMSPRFSWRTSCSRLGTMVGPSLLVMVWLLSPLSYFILFFLGLVLAMQTHLTWMNVYLLIRHSPPIFFCSLLSCILSSACHKLLPSAGLGAVTSMQDAVVLANCLYEMKGLSQDDINDTLIKFKEERYSRVKAQCEASRMNAKLLYGQVRFFEVFYQWVRLGALFCHFSSTKKPKGSVEIWTNSSLYPPCFATYQSWIDRLLRTIVFNWLPESFRLRGNMKGLEFRPQATFLPQVPVRGIGYVVPQMVSQRYLNEQTKLKA